MLIRRFLSSFLLMAVLVTTSFTSIAQTPASVSVEQAYQLPMEETSTCACQTKQEDTKQQNGKNTITSKAVTDATFISKAVAKMKQDKLLAKAKQDARFAKFELDTKTAVVKEIDISRLEMKDKIADKNTNTSTTIKVLLRSKDGEEGQLTYTYTDKYEVAQYAVQVKGEPLEKRKAQLATQQVYKRLVEQAIQKGYRVDEQNTIGLQSVAYFSDIEEVNTNTGVVIPVVNQFDVPVGKIMKFDSKSLPILQLENEVVTYKDGQFVSMAGESCSTYVGCVINCFCSGANYQNCLMQITGCIAGCCGCTGFWTCLYCASCWYGYYYCALIECN